MKAFTVTLIALAFIASTGCRSMTQLREVNGQVAEYDASLVDTWDAALAVIRSEGLKIAGIDKDNLTMVVTDGKAYLVSDKYRMVLQFRELTRNRCRVQARMLLPMGCNGHMGDWPHEFLNNLQSMINFLAKSPHSRGAFAADR